jgi:hypothetical protein
LSPEEAAEKDPAAVVGFPEFRRISQDAQDCILGYSQPSLRDCSMVSNPTQDSRPGLLSAVPSGLSSRTGRFSRRLYGPSELFLCVRAKKHLAPLRIIRGHAFPAGCAVTGAKAHVRTSLTDMVPRGVCLSFPDEGRVAPHLARFSRDVGFHGSFLLTLDSSDALRGQSRWYPISREKRARYGAHVPSCRCDKYYGRAEFVG